MGAAVAEAAWEAEVGEAAAAVAAEAAIQAEAVDLAVVVEAVEAAGAKAAEHHFLPNRQARAPELLVKVINPICSAGPRLLLVGIPH